MYAKQNKKRNNKIFRLSSPFKAKKKKKNLTTKFQIMLILLF